MAGLSDLAQAAQSAEAQARDAARQAAADHWLSLAGASRNRWDADDMPAFVCAGSELIALRRTIAARLRGPGRAGTIARAAELWRQRSRGSIANEDEVVRWEAQQVWA